MIGKEQAMSDEMAEYDALVLQIGGAELSVPAAEADIALAESLVSASYHTFLKKYGYAVFDNGSFQLINPSKFAPILPRVFRDDRQLNADRMCCIGMSAFGDLLVCQKDFGLVNVVFAQHWISTRVFAEDFETQIDQRIQTALFASTEEPDNYDENGEPLFARCLAKLGALGPGQIYAPVLPPAAGGNLDISNYKIADATVAIALNAQWDGFRLMDFSDPAGPRFVRNVG
jgi:hypothetical protein